MGEYNKLTRSQCDSLHQLGREEQKQIPVAIQERLRRGRDNSSKVNTLNSNSVVLACPILTVPPVVWAMLSAGASMDTVEVPSSSIKFASVSCNKENSTDAQQTHEHEPAQKEYIHESLHY